MNCILFYIVDLIANCSLARCLSQRTWLPKFRVIASQSADWRGNPLQISGMSMGIPTSALRASSE